MRSTIELPAAIAQMVVFVLKSKWSMNNRALIFSVCPDLANSCHFDKILKIFVSFFEVLFTN